jgi:hypothetical protein
MALVNPNIAMSYKPTTEYQPRNALADYAQIQQIKGGQQQAEMANMEMQEYKRKRDRLNKIQAAMVRSGGPSDLRAGAMEMMNYPESLVEGKKLLQELDDTAKLEQYIAGQAGGKPSAVQPAANALAPNVPATPMMPGALGSGTFDIAPPPAANALAPTAAPVANALAPAAPMDEVTQLEADIARLSGNTNPRAIAIVANLEKRLAKLQPFAVGSNIYDPVTKTFITGPKERTSTLRTPQELEQEMQIRAAGRSITPRAEPAPSIAQIEDPNNPGRMITIDARRYVPGTNVGVIGSAGKTTAAAKDEEKREFGKSQLQSELDNLRTAYATLETMRAIPSTERSGASNVLSSIAATGLGQTTGRVFGTEAQVERDVINSSKLRLMNAIKQATGISAQQLNSNVELQTMLKSLSDPSQATQTVDRIIESLEKQVKNLSATDKPKTPATPSAPANIDALLDKYK